MQKQSTNYQNAFLTKRVREVLVLVAFIACAGFSVVGQTTEFTYQGSLKDGASPANGNYSFEFLLFDSLSAGAQLGPILTRSSVPVTNGVFSVKLDFGSQFPGANRFLEIHVISPVTGVITPLTPRQSMGSSPYAIQSLNATNATNAASATNANQLGGVAASQYVLTGDARLSDARAPAAGSSNYVQNGTTVQASSNFNISGTGTANILNAGTQFNIAGGRILSNPGNSNLFVGTNAGNSITSGSGNLLFGPSAGTNNSTGSNNNFFGFAAGATNSSGGENTFVGNAAGTQNSTSSDNAFFGASTGGSNTTGNGNAFFGRSAGFTNTTGTFNTAIGSFANVATNNLTFATAIGSGSTVSTSHTIVLGTASETVQVPGTLNVAGSLTGNFSVPAANISGILGPLSGGTGIGGSFPVAGTFLRSNGAGWSATGISASDVPSGSASYVQNGTSQQSASNFNVSGTGTANIFNAATQFNIGGARVLSVTGTDNAFAGTSAGNANVAGVSNSFFGSRAGFANTGGNSNSFFGSLSGETNTTGGFNAFFGYASGDVNTTGNRNTFIGVTAGRDNTLGDDNTFVGGATGQHNISGGLNSFFGTTAGISNTTGSSNSFFGNNAGQSNISGTFNTAIGTGSNVASGALTFATALGAGALVSTSNTLVLGRAADTVQIPGNLNLTGTLTANLPAGSTNYIQNTSAGPASSFHITGTGRADRFSADTSFDIGPIPVFSVGPDTTAVFAGRNTGIASTGSENVFVGLDAGKTTTGGFNTFIGGEAGSAPFSHPTGTNNAFLGFNSGLNNSTGSFNTAIGSNAGEDVNAGTRNTSLGFNSGNANNTGNNNTAIGADADFGTFNLNNATAIGSQARVSQSNSLVLGSIAGAGNGTADTNVGIGTTAPNYRLHVVGQEVRLEGNTQPRFSLNFTTGTVDAKKWYHRVATDELVFALLNDAENVETPWMRVTRSGMTVTNISLPTGTVSIGTLGSAGSTALCRNASNQISTCSSSARYKNNIRSFSSGLDLIRKLRPVTFNWKEGGMRDMGLVAEEVNSVEPLLTTTNAKGEVEGVKYDRVGVVLINAIKEQQTQIEAQQKQIEKQNEIIERQRADFEALRALVCAQKPSAAVCRPPKLIGEEK